MNDDLNELAPQGIEPSGEMIPVTYIDVNGREEHEALLRDHKKMISFGLDPCYEICVYLKRWGSWLNESN
jgi:hypothetical protein